MANVLNCIVILERLMTKVARKVAAKNKKLTKIIKAYENNSMIRNIKNNNIF